MTSSPVQFIGKHKELIPIFVIVAVGVGLASSYVSWKAFNDNQVVIDRRRPYQYAEKDAVQFGKKVFKYNPEITYVNSEK